MRIDSGVVTIEIERDGNHAGGFSFNPENVEFRESVLKMFNEFKTKDKELKEKVAKLKPDTEVDEHGMPLNIADAIKIERETIKWATDIINELFGDIIELVFGGEPNMYMLYQFFDEIMPHIQSKSSEKVEKYLNREQRRALK